ncbi:hypothetical protein DL96DRAFT_1685239 [Flagelloscypha sp. PMI_526]|nr:hypothetical protein DL96DRAFT_1685239 [Flagelloscypha sp. PMI_526]
MSCIIIRLQAWGKVVINGVLAHWTLFPVFHELATNPHLQSEDLEHFSECLGARSKIVMTVHLAIVALTWAASDVTPSEILAPFIILLWSILNRAYYESLPLAELQVRVQNSNPGIVAFLYAIPELYQVYFIIYEVAIHGGWVSSLLVGIVFGIHVALRGLAIYRAGRRQTPTVLKQTWLKMPGGGELQRTQHLIFIPTPIF